MTRGMLRSKVRLASYLASALFLIAIITLAWVSFHASNSRGGYLTIQTDFTEILEGAKENLNERRGLGLPEPSLDDLNDAAGEVKSALPEAASQVKSAAKTAATEVVEGAESLRDDMLSLLDRLWEKLPEAVTIGTTGFCLESPDSATCADLPPSVEASLPDDVPDLVADTLPELSGALSDLKDVLSSTEQLTSAAFKACWAVCFVMMILATVVAISCRRFATLFVFIFGSVALFSLLCPVALAAVISGHVDALPDWITMTHEKVVQYHCIAAACNLAFTVAWIAIIWL